MSSAACANCKTVFKYDNLKDKSICPPQQQQQYQQLIIPSSPVTVIGEIPVQFPCGISNTVSLLFNQNPYNKPYEIKAVFVIDEQEVQSVTIIPAYTKLTNHWQGEIQVCFLTKYQGKEGHFVLKCKNQVLSQPFKFYVPDDGIDPVTNSEVTSSGIDDIDDVEDNVPLDKLNELDAHGFARIHYAAFNGNLLTLTRLKAIGCDLTLKDKVNGKTPFEWAVEGGHLFSMQILVSCTAPSLYAQLNSASDISSELPFEKVPDYKFQVQTLVSGESKFYLFEKRCVELLTRQQLDSATVYKLPSEISTFIKYSQFGIFPLRPNNVVGLLSLANHFNEESLQSQCKNYISNSFHIGYLTKLSDAFLDDTTIDLIVPLICKFGPLVLFSLMKENVIHPRYLLKLLSCPELVWDSKFDLFIFKTILHSCNHWKKYIELETFTLMFNSLLVLVDAKALKQQDSKVFTKELIRIMKEYPSLDYNLNSTFQKLLLFQHCKPITYASMQVLLDHTCFHHEQILHQNMAYLAVTDKFICSFVCKQEVTSICKLWKHGFCIEEGNNMLLYCTTKEVWSKGCVNIIVNEVIDNNIVMEPHIIQLHGYNPRTETVYCDYLYLLNNLHYDLLKQKSNDETIFTIRLFPFEFPVTIDMITRSKCSALIGAMNSGMTESKQRVIDITESNPLLPEDAVLLRIFFYTNRVFAYSTSQFIRMMRFFDMYALDDYVEKVSSTINNYLDKYFMKFANFLQSNENHFQNLWSKCLETICQQDLDEDEDFLQFSPKVITAIIQRTSNSADSVKAIRVSELSTWIHYDFDNRKQMIAVLVKYLIKPEDCSAAILQLRKEKVFDLELMEHIASHCSKHVISFTILFNWLDEAFDDRNGYFEKTVPYINADEYDSIQRVIDSSPNATKWQEHPVVLEKLTQILSEAN